MPGWTSTPWSNGSAPRGLTRWRAVVEQRRAAVREWARHDSPPALGPVPEVIDDPAIVMLWGITRENLERWLNADAGTDTREIRGFAASSGVAEGIARVVKSVEEISRLQPGEILVCQVTNPTWASVFQKIAAAVSDIGGTMSHGPRRNTAAPVMAGTMSAVA